MPLMLCPLSDFVALQMHRAHVPRASRARPRLHQLQQPVGLVPVLVLGDGRGRGVHVRLRAGLQARGLGLQDVSPHRRLDRNSRLLQT